MKELDINVEFESDERFINLFRTEKRATSKIDSTRNDKAVAFSLRDANFKCECDDNHVSFISEKTGKNILSVII